MKKYKCINTFFSIKNKKYSYGDIIDDFDYSKLLYSERNNFEQIEEPSFLSSISDTPVSPDTIIDSTSLFSSDNDSSSWNSSNDSFDGFGGGDSGGGGASSEW